MGFPLTSLARGTRASQALVVLDAFQNRFLEERDPTGLAMAHAIVGFARENGWPVCHVLRRPPESLFDPEDASWHPIEGLAPAPTDMTFVTVGDTPFASRPFTERLCQSRPDTVLYLSLALPVNRERTLAEAQSRGLSFLQVTDQHIIGVCHPLTNPYMVRDGVDVRNTGAAAHPVFGGGSLREAVS